MSARELSTASDETLLGAVAGMFNAIDPTPTVPSPAHLAALAAQPIVCTTTRYRCPHCTRFSRSKRAAVVAHMGRCWRNPAVRACVTCAHFSRTEPDPDAPRGFEYCEALHAELAALQDGCPLWTLRGAS